MESAERAETQRRAAAAPAQARLPVHTLAIATGLAGLAAQLLSRTGHTSADAEYGSLSLVMGQALWNAAQVGLLLLLFCLWRLDRRWWVGLLTLAVVVCLPVSIYSVGPGAWALAALMLAACLAALVRGVPDLSVSIADAPARGTPLFAKVELLALACYLLSSIYNLNASRGQWPDWYGLLGRVSDWLGSAPDQAAIANALYGIGMEGANLPAYVHLGYPVHNMSAIVFALIWTVLPLLYVCLFAVCAMLAEKSPGPKWQRALCYVCIFHFLLLTDIVDYRFGRGIANPWAEWAHWSERFAWRVAILLPVYQNVATKFWLRGNGMLGPVIHYGVGIGAALFFILQVLLGDLPNFYRFASGDTQVFDWLLGLQHYYYYRMLVIMAGVYAFLVFFARCKRISARAMTSV